MGKNYSSTDARYVDDKMYQLPWELMGKVIEKKDKAVDDTIDSSILLLDKLKAQGLAVDEPELKKILKGYEDKVDGIVKNIQSNPMEYHKQSGEIRGLSRAINNDWEHGKVAAIQGNRATYLDAKKNWAELAKKDPKQYNQEYIGAIDAKSLADYTGVKYDDATGTYNNFNPMEATGMADLNEWVDERLKGAIPDAREVERDTLQGGYIVTTKSGTKQHFSEEDVERLLGDAFNADTALQSAIRQRSSLGINGFGNVLDEKGNFDTKGQNIIGEAFRAGKNKFGFSQEIDSRTMKADDYAKMDYASAIKKKEEEEDRAIIEVSELKDTFTSGGVNGLNTNNYRFTEGMKTAVSLATKQFETLAGNKKWSAQAIEDAKALIASGNFEALRKVGVPDATIKKFRNDYRDNSNGLLSIEAIKRDYLEANGGKVPMTADGKVDNAKFDAWIKTNSEKYGQQNNIDQQSSWAFTGLTTKDIKSVTKSAIESIGAFTMDLGENRVLKNIDGKDIYFDPKAKDASGNFKFKDGVSMADLIKNRIIVEKTTQEVVGEKSIFDTNSKGEQVDSGETQKEYIYYGSGKPANFTIGENSMGLINGKSNNGTSDIGFVVAAPGRTLIARMPTSKVSSVKINEAIESTQDARTFADQIDRTAKTVIEKEIYGETYKWDNSRGKEKGTITAPDGRVFQVNSPQGQALLKYMYGFD